MSTKDAEMGAKVDGWRTATLTPQESVADLPPQETTPTYNGKDGACLGKSKKDGMIAYKIRGNVPIAQSEAAHVEALQQGSL